MPRPLAADTGLTLYRTAQEALSNVRKHAPGAATTVTLRREEEELRVSVHNDGTAVPSADLGPGGHGLVGMAERVRLYGGRLRAEAVADGFRVEAGIPLVVS